MYIYIYTPVIKGGNGKVWFIFNLPTKTSIFFVLEIPSLPCAVGWPWQVGEAFATALGAELSLKIQIVGVQDGMGERWYTNGVSVNSEVIYAVQNWSSTVCRTLFLCSTLCMFVVWVDTESNCAHVRHTHQEATWTDSYWFLQIPSSLWNCTLQLLALTKAKRTPNTGQTGVAVHVPIFP